MRTVALLATALLLSNQGAEAFPSGKPSGKPFPMKPKQSGKPNFPGKKQKPVSTTQKPNRPGSTTGGRRPQAAAPPSNFNKAPKQAPPQGGNQGGKIAVAKDAAAVKMSQGAAPGGTARFPNCGVFDECVNKGTKVDACCGRFPKEDKRDCAICARAACTLRADFCKHQGGKKDPYCNLCHEIARHEAAEEKALSGKEQGKAAPRSLASNKKSKADEAKEKAARAKAAKEAQKKREDEQRKERVKAQAEQSRQQQQQKIADQNARILEQKNQRKRADRERAEKRRKAQMRGPFGMLSAAKKSKKRQEI